jgi:hypothetical protein
VLAVSNEGTRKSLDGSPKERGQQEEELEKAIDRGRTGKGPEINRGNRSRQRGRQEALDAAEEALRGSKP